MVRRILPVFLAVLLGAVHAAGDEYADLSHRLQSQQQLLGQIDADLQQARDDAERIRSRERNIAHRLVDVTNRISHLEHTIGRLTRSEQQLRTDMTSATARIETLRVHIADRHELMERRVRVLYTQGRRQPYQRALLASSLKHWLAARHYMTTLNQRDEIDIQHLQIDRRHLVHMVSLYRDQQETLDSLIVRQREQRDELVTSQREARGLFHRVRRSRTLAERAAQELEAQKADSERRISEYLTERERAGASSTDNTLVGSASALVDFSELRGRLPWPAAGDILRRFGRTRDAATRTWTRNRGIDIGATRGTQVMTVANGQVAMVDWARGYGTFVIVAHGGDYYTLYANLETVFVSKDDQLRQGQPVGVSGVSSMGEQKLHFELLAGRDAIDPLQWLEPRTDG